MHMVVCGVAVGWFMVLCSCSGLLNDVEGEIAAPTCEVWIWGVVVVVWEATTASLDDCILFSIEVPLELCSGSS